MKHFFRNGIGQIVGEYEDTSKTYWTTRSKEKGEIFIRKNWFNGKYIHLPVAIDQNILDKLLNVGCERIDILITGVKKSSYVVSLSPIKLKKEGETINYDLVRQGRNYTHFGTQIVFDISQGIEGGQNQKTLT